MEDSILTSTKLVLGIAGDLTVFDEAILVHINSTFSTLQQLGIGPLEGFEIEDASALWSTYLEGDIPKNSVKTYMYLKVRMLFDPPTTSYHLAAMNEQIRELEYRLNVYRESTQWVSPTAP